METCNALLCNHNSKLDFIMMVLYNSNFIITIETKVIIILSYVKLRWSMQTNIPSLLRTHKKIIINITYIISWVLHV